MEVSSAADIATPGDDNVDIATGRGVGVALIDTGVTPVAGLQDVVHGIDVSTDRDVPELRDLDAYGHGTHLAGLVTSNRPDAPGMAPDAALISVKAGAFDGSVETAQVIAAVEWATANADPMGIDVVVLAYGTDDSDPAARQLVTVVERAVDAGIVVVASAGNHGEESAALSHPASSERVIAVGGIDGWQTPQTEDDRVATYSPAGTARRSVDVLAAGTRVTSTGVAGSWLSQAHPEADRGRGLFRGTGTSQAAALVGGAAALLLEQAPDLTPAEVAAVLRNTSSPIVGSAAGVIDMTAALAALQDTASEESSDLGWDGQRWDGQRWDGQRWDGQRWDGQRWDGQRWDGQRWDGQRWDGQRWDGQRWDGQRWDGQRWDGQRWDGQRWDGQRWDGQRWDGQRWDGQRWDGQRWDGQRWDGQRWDGQRWDGQRWDGQRWDGQRWDGQRWDGQRWDGQRWDGQRWDGQRWDGQRWDGQRWDGQRWD